MLGDKGTGLHVMAFAKADPQPLVVPCVCCAFVYLLSMPSSRGIACPRDWLWSPTRLGGLWSRSRAAELGVSEIQAAAREPESTVGCVALTLGG